MHPIKTTGVAFMFLLAVLGSLHASSLPCSWESMLKQWYLHQTGLTCDTGAEWGEFPEDFRCPYSAQLTTAKEAKIGWSIYTGRTRRQHRISLCLKWASTVIPMQGNWILQATKGKAKSNLKRVFSAQCNLMKMTLEGKTCTMHYLITNWAIPCMLI